ncbi:MAG: hypothetical protein EOP84_06755 [Verrucomicrobiaceae bacterium]|nr:MAG: hypothetical protein EOP84_06755 [Verrucomicrobiaceae bacterium]
MKSKAVTDELPPSFRRPGVRRELRCLGAGTFPANKDGMKAILALLVVGALTSCDEDDSGKYHGTNGDNRAVEKIDGRQETLLPGSRHGGNGKAQSDVPAE